MKTLWSGKFQHGHLTISLSSLTIIYLYTNKDTGIEIEGGFSIDEGTYEVSSIVDKTIKYIEQDIQSVLQIQKKEYINEGNKLH